MADLIVAADVDALLASANAAEMRANLGLGSAAVLSAAAFATETQGALADSAIQSGDLGSAAFLSAATFATAAQGALADTALQDADVGTAAAANTGDFATTAQGATADTALQPGDEPFALVTESTTARTLVLTDAQKYIRCTNGSAVTVTVPPQTGVAWAADTEVIVEQAGAGQVTIAAGAGVTLRTSQTLLSAAQYGAVTLKRVAADEWVVGGEREAA